MNKDSFHINTSSRVTGREICRYLENQGIGFTYSGDELVGIDGFCPLREPKTGCITWVRHAEDANVEKLNCVRDILLVAELDAKILGAQFPILYAVNAHRTFFRILAHFFGNEDPENRAPAIASTAVIESEHIGEGVYIGHHTYIGEDVIIGDHVQILNNVSIQGKVSIGDYTVIESGTSIGVCGYGHYIDEDGHPVCVPHLGGVRIGRHVKIGANNTIARGCLSDTVLEDYVKTDNLSHIGHNVHVKQGAMVICSLLAGSSTIEENAWLAPGTVINNAVTVGKDAYLGLGTIATKDIPEKKVAVGVPARVIHDRKI